MADKQEINPLLRRPLYVYDLPRELLLSLTLVERTRRHQQQIEESTESASKQLISDPQDGDIKSTSCSFCGVAFNTVQDQRNHVRSDFHKYNLKLSLKQMPAINEATFIRLIGDLDESISGSESSESEDDQEAKTDTLSALLKRQAKLSQPEQKEQDDVSQKQVSSTSPMIWMSSPKIGSDSVLGIYRALFLREQLEGKGPTAIEILRKKQLTPVQGKHSGTAQVNGPRNVTVADPHYFLCMIGGGHFAAMIVSLVPEIRRGQGGIEERHPIVRVHKTFHRYTTRRKQGGSQSANDNAKGNAHSVGSSIRRANEAALEAEIRVVLSDWRSMIDSAELLFIRATGSANRRTLFGPYDGQVLSTRDERLRSFPFSTRRATQAELLRAFQELTRLKISKLVEQPSAPTKPETTASKAPKPKVEAPKLSKDDEAAQLHTGQLQTLIRRSKAPGLLLYLSKNSLSPDFHFFPASEHHHAPTPIHLSASTNASALVSALLLKAKADPTSANGEGKTPYDLAGDHRTRDAFRVARHTLGEDAFDWISAHVPSGISQAEADSRAQTDKSESEGAEAKRRREELAKIQQQEEQGGIDRMERKAGSGKSLSAATEKTGAEKREEEARGLTPEMRMRLERERRARAAEERFRKLQGGQ